jgi:PEP-CTERM putative exosortase interaction domain
MRKVSLAVLAFAATLVFAPPSASGDSFGYKTRNAPFGFDAGTGNVRNSVPNGIAESGIFTNLETSGASGATIGGAFGRNAVQPKIDGAFFFENLLQSGNQQFDDHESSGALVDLNGHEMVLLSGANGESVAGAKGGQVFFADKGNYHVSNELQKGTGTARSNATALTVTPEPGSLFLLGTGLLGLALVLFWKAARRSDEPE